jgi:hypothetical protein
MLALLARVSTARSGDGARAAHTNDGARRAVKLTFHPDHSVGADHQTTLKSELLISQLFRLLSLEFFCDSFHDAA